MKFLQWQIHFLFIKFLCGTPLYTLAHWLASYLLFFPSFFHVQTILGIIWFMTSPFWSSQPTPSTSPSHNLMISCLGIANFASYSSGPVRGGRMGWELVQKGKEKNAIFVCHRYLYSSSIPSESPSSVQYFSADKTVLHYNRYTSYPPSSILTMPKTKRVWSLDHKNTYMETTISGWMDKENVEYG